MSNFSYNPQFFCQKSERVLMEFCKNNNGITEILLKNACSAGILMEFCWGSTKIVSYFIIPLLIISEFWHIFDNR